MSTSGSKKPHHVPMLITFLVGILVAVIIIMTVNAYLLPPLIELLPLKIIDIALYTGVDIIIFAVVVWGGRVSVEVGFGDGLFFLKRPIESLYLTPGTYWIPRWFMSTRSVDMREETMPVEIKVIACGNDDGDQNKVDMLVELIVHTKVDNPVKYLEVKNNVITAGLSALFTEVIRIEATELDATNFMEKKREFGVATKEAAQEPSDRWGITVLSVSVKRIIPISPEVKQSFEQSGIEKREALAKEIEYREAIERGLKIQKDFGVTGEEALRTVMRGIGNAPEQEIVFTGAADSLTQLAAILKGGKSS